MDYHIKRAGLRGRLNIPASKSVSHRAVLAAALAEGESRLTGVLASRDLTATIEGLRTMGVTIERDGADLVVKGGLKGTCGTIDCHESGSTIRFLIPVSLLTEGKYRFTGCGKLVDRPLGVFKACFEEKGIAVDYHEQLPFICQGPLVPGTYRIRGDVSSQFVTGLLYALPLLGGDSEIVITHGFESKPYVDLTVKMLSQFGVQIQEREQGYFIPGGQHYTPQKVAIEGDFSQAAFWIVAALFAGPLQLSGLDLDSLQGDKAILSIVQNMGGRIDVLAEGITVWPSETDGCQIDASQVPDLVPILAVLASVSSGITRIVRAERVRLKESDRLLAIQTELNKMGADVRSLPDGLEIHGVKHLNGAEVDGWNDHRIVMALAVAALKSTGPMIIHGAEAIEKSYPHFFEDYRQLGGDAHE